MRACQKSSIPRLLPYSYSPKQSRSRFLVVAKKNKNKNTQHSFALPIDASKLYIHNKTLLSEFP